MAFVRPTIRRWARCFRWFSGQGFKPETATYYEFQGARGMQHNPEEDRECFANALGHLVFLPHHEGSPRHPVEAAFALLGIAWRATEGGQGAPLETTIEPRFTLNQREEFENIRRRIEMETSDTYDQRYEFVLVERNAARLRMLSLLNEFSQNDVAEIGDRWEWSPLRSQGEFRPRVLLNGTEVTDPLLSLRLGTQRGAHGLVVSDSWNYRAVVAEYENGFLLTTFDAVY